MVSLTVECLLLLQDILTVATEGNEADVELKTCCTKIPISNIMYTGILLWFESEVLSTLKEAKINEVSRLGPNSLGAMSCKGHMRTQWEVIQRERL